MHETENLKSKLTLFTNLLVPILITQVSMFLMNFFDTVMSGRAGATDLAGVAIGSSLWVPIFTGVNGIILAVTPIIAHLLGAKKEREITEKVKQAIYLSIAQIGRASCRERVSLSAPTAPPTLTTIHTL